MKPTHAVLLFVLFLSFSPAPHAAPAPSAICGQYAGTIFEDENLVFRVAIQKPVLMEKDSRREIPAEYLDEKGAQVFSYPFDSFKRYSKFSVNAHGMIRGAELLFGKAFVCASLGSQKIGVGRSLEDAFRDFESKKR